MQKLIANDYLTREERKQLLKKNDWLAAFEILQELLIIAAVFVVVYFWTNPFTVLIGLFILGGRQLGLTVVMHDAGHRAIFKSPKLNDFVGQWIGAYPMFHNMYKYRSYHFVHHTTTGLDEDPDILLTRGYPASKKSMIRKFTRDLTGQTGIKSFIGLVMMSLGYLTYNLGGNVERVSQKDRSWSEFFKVFFENLAGPIFVNVLLFAILSYFASPWLYLLWVGAYLTTFQLSIRIRAMAEHSMVDDPTDPMRNTRTTYANWWERLLFAPYHVNYHLEHHMLMAVPSYNLPKMHEILKKKGFYEKGLLEHSYSDVIRLAIKEL